MLEKIRDILLEYKDIPRDSIKPESSFFADIKMNSLDIMDMIGQVEEEYDILISTDDLKDITTVQDLMDYLEDVM